APGVRPWSGCCGRAGPGSGDTGPAGGTRAPELPPVADEPTGRPCTGGGVGPEFVGDAGPGGLPAGAAGTAGTVTPGDGTSDFTGVVGMSGSPAGADGDFGATAGPAGCGAKSSGGATTGPPGAAGATGMSRS